MHLTSRNSDVLYFVVHEPLQEGFVILGQLDFSLIFGVERRNDIDDLLIEPAAGVVEIDPVLVVAQFGRSTALAGRSHEIDDLHAEAVRKIDRLNIGAANGVDFHACIVRSSAYFALDTPRSALFP